MGSRFLMRNAYARSTLRKYDGAVSEFLQWSRMSGNSAWNVQDLDEIMCDYLYYLFEDGQGRTKGVETIYGLIALFPGWRAAFPSASLSLKGWRRLVPVSSYPPLTWDLTVLLACEVTRMGHPVLGLGFLLSFDCLLRINELLALGRDDVATPSDLRLGVSGSDGGVRLRLKVTKTGRDQWVAVKSIFVTTWLLSLLRTIPKGVRIFPYSAIAARAIFKKAALSLGMSSSYVPHSLRHGGATALHLAGVSMEDILLRGRWSSVKSARAYIQVGKALLLDMVVSPELLTRARTAADQLSSRCAGSRL